jgi:hypothetical protein
VAFPFAINKRWPALFEREYSKGSPHYKIFFIQKKRGKKNKPVQLNNRHQNKKSNRSKDDGRRN